MEGSKGSKNQRQIMPYAQCKTYEQKNECAKYIINFFLVIQFFLLKNLLKKPYIQKTKTYSVFRSKRKHTKNKKKIL
jgi:hypothetical protein